MEPRLACGDGFSEVVYSSATLEAILIMAAVLAVGLTIFPGLRNSL